MLKRLFLVWAVATLALWDVAPFIPSSGLLYSPRPLLGADLPAALTPAEDAGITAIEYRCTDYSGTTPCTGKTEADTAEVTLRTPTTRGELIVVLTAGGPAGTAYGSVTDSADETYTQSAIARTGYGGGHYEVTLWYVCSSAFGVTSVTWTYGLGDSKNYSAMVVAHYKGVTSCAVDRAANFSGAHDTPFASTSVTTTEAPELLVGPVWANPASTPTLTGASGWTNRIMCADGNATFLALFDQVASSAGRYHTTGTSSVDGSYYYPAVIAFK